MTLMTWDHKGKENVNQIYLKSGNLWEESNSQEKREQAKGGRRYRKREALSH